MYYFYILYNETIDRFYVGYTSNLQKRLLEHNKASHKSKFTRKQAGAWNLIYSETYRIKSNAIKREKEVKRWKSKSKIKSLVEQSR